ncbi:tuftelin interacting protein [Pelomyxa schiedti]|nr:tuftelin interacting protein [Pelomyxa schiedti]
MPTENSTPFRAIGSDLGKFSSLKQFNPFEITEGDARALKRTGAFGGGSGGASKRRRKESQMLGVFGEDSDDDLDNDYGGWGRKRGLGGGGGGRRNDDAGHDYSKPMSFVMRGVYTADNEKDGKNGEGDEGDSEGGEGDTNQYEDEYVPDGFDAPPPRPRASSMQSFGKQRGGRAGIGSAKSSGGADTSAESVTFDRQYGIGSKLLHKMGWKPGEGVGREGNQGIVEPIQVKVRPKNRGLSCNFNDAKQDSNPVLKNKEEPTLVTGLNVPIELLTSLPEENKLWKKGSVKKQTTKYKLDFGENRDIAAPQVIVDMRGPVSRVIAATPTSGIDAGASIRDVIAGPLPELQHNIRLLVEISQANVSSCERRAASERDRVEVLKRERERVEAAASTLAAKISQGEALSRAVANLSAISKNHPSHPATGGTGSVIQMSTEFAKMRKDFPEHWVKYHVSALALSVMTPLLREFFKEWSPLSNPAYALEIFKIWHSILCCEEEAWHKSPDFDYNDEDVYIQLLAEVLLPRLRAAVGTWSARNYDPFINFLTLWKPLLPTMVYDNIISQLIMPQLQSEVLVWNPRVDIIPVHSWLHPWLPVIDSKVLEPLWQICRHKLSVVLTDWHPADPSAHAVLLPWKNVFDTSSMESLLSRCIVPKLTVALHTMLSVTPHAQVLDPFTWVMQWCDLVDTKQIVALLDTEFFPRWYTALATWLSASSPRPDYEEIDRWYRGWSAQFPQNVLHHPRVMAHFARALDAINHALSGADTSTLLNTPLPPQPAASMQAAVADEKKKKEEKHRNGDIEEGDDEISLRDVVEKIAAENDILLVPTKRMHDGKPVFKFGPLNIVIDKHLLYAEEKGTGTKSWRTVSLGELLHYGQTNTNINTTNPAPSGGGSSVD